MTIPDVQGFQVRMADTQTSHKFRASQSLRQHVGDDEVDRVRLRVVEALLTGSRLDNCKACLAKGGGHESSNVTVFADDQDDVIRQGVPSVPENRASCAMNVALRGPDQAKFAAKQVSNLTPSGGLASAGRRCRASAVAVSGKVTADRVTTLRFNATADLSEMKQRR
jgi:hypothetical protein